MKSAEVCLSLRICRISLIKTAPRSRLNTFQGLKCLKRFAVMVKERAENTTDLRSAFWCISAAHARFSCGRVLLQTWIRTWNPSQGGDFVSEDNSFNFRSECVALSAGVPHSGRDKKLDTVATENGWIWWAPETGRLGNTATSNIGELQVTGHRSHTHTHLHQKLQ